ncbi:hypothetical protein HK101_007176, partial [Irineochytrium annulatum]
MATGFAELLGFLDPVRSVLRPVAALTSFFVLAAGVPVVALKFIFVAACVDGDGAVYRDDAVVFGLILAFLMRAFSVAPMTVNKLLFSPPVDVPLIAAVAYAAISTSWRLQRALTIVEFVTCRMVPAIGIMGPVIGYMAGWKKGETVGGNLKTAAMLGALCILSSGLE